MPLPLSWNSGLGMKVTVLPYWLATLRMMYLYSMVLSAHCQQRVELHVDFGLAAGGHFVVMALHLDAALHHGGDHLRAQVLVVVGGRHREVAFLVARTVAEIVFLAAGVPAALFGVDEVEAEVLALIEADIVEDEELQLGAEVDGIGDAGGVQVHLRFLGDVARVAVVTLLGDRILNVGDHHQGGNFGERIEPIGRRHPESGACRSRGWRPIRGSRTHPCRSPLRTRLRSTGRSRRRRGAKVRECR